MRRLENGCFWCPSLFVFFKTEVERYGKGTTKKKEARFSERAKKKEQAPT